MVFSHHGDDGLPFREQRTVTRMRLTQDADVKVLVDVIATHLGLGVLLASM